MSKSIAGFRFLRLKPVKVLQRIKNKIRLTLKQLALLHEVEAVRPKRKLFMMLSKYIKSYKFAAKVRALSMIIRQPSSIFVKRTGIYCTA